MPVTPKYSFPWPSGAAFLRNGAAAIGELATAVEAALRPPLIVTDGDGGFAWGGDKTAEVAWDITDDPNRKRGDWTSRTNLERLVIPGQSGWYFVQASVCLTGKAEPDVYDVRIVTRDVGSAIGSIGTTWGRDKRDVPNSSADDSVVSLSSLVRIDKTGGTTGFAIRLQYKGSTQPPDTIPGNNKLRAYRLSAL